MTRNEITAGASLGGAGVLAVCSCGTATGTVALLGAAGVAATNPMVHPLFIGTGAVLLVWGLWQRRPRAGMLALIGMGLLAGGALLAPASVMTSTGFPHPPSHLAGFVLYLSAAAMVVWAFLTAFPPPKKGGVTAAVGMGFAAGCTCCMATGSLAGLLGTMGIGLPWIYDSSIIFFGAMALVTYGLWSMAGWRAAAWAPAGALVLWGAGDLLRAIAEDMPLWGVNMRWAPAYLFSLIGVGLVMTGFVQAYRIARAGAASDAPPPPAVPEPSTREPALTGD